MCTLCIRSISSQHWQVGVLQSRYFLVCSTIRSYLGALIPSNEPRLLFISFLGSKSGLNRIVLNLATQGVLLQAGGSTILSISDVTPWLRPLTHPMA